MTSTGWRKAWSRLAEMSWDEFQTRAAQETGKRLDLARYRLRLGSAGNGLRPQGNGAAAGKFFFFLPDELPKRTGIIRERLPHASDEIVREAEELLHHRFHLLGYTALDYGREIDWHLDAVSGKRGPLRPWFKIPFLDFSQVGDHKVTWELNRHQHFATLAKAWRLTGDSRYAGEIASQWASWQPANPYPLGINWASSLEVAFRSLSWLWVRELLRDCEAVPAALEKEMLQALALNGRHIERYLSTYFSPNTHLIGEAAALFFIGTLCPQLRAAHRWQERGWRILLAEAARQVRLDGIHFEQSLYYHVYALDFFLHARQLAVSNGIEVPAGFDQTLVRMLGVLQTLSLAGVAEGFGDDDGGRVFDPHRNRVEHMQDPLALGAGIFGGFKAPELTEEAVWLLGLERLSETPCPPSELESRAFDAGGIYVMACPDPAAQCMTVDAGPQGMGGSGHGHADALSVRLALGGRRWLIDSGASSYIDASQDRDLFRGTAAHNTLRIDGQDQALPEGPFAWSSIPSVSVERWIQGATFTLLTARHNGYERLKDPVLHRRFVLHLHEGIDDQHGFWLVRDVAEGKGTHELEIFWHLASDLIVTRETEAFLAAAPQPRLSSPEIRQIGLHLLPASTPAWTHELGSAYASPAYGVKEEAPIVRSRARVELPAECATLLLAERDAGPNGCGKFERLACDELAEVRAASGYRHTRRDLIQDLFFAQAEEDWRFGPWTSDARLLYCRFQGRLLTQMVLCAGSYAAFHDKTVVRNEGIVERIEYIKQDGAAKIFSSDPAAAGSISEAIAELSL